MEPDDPTRVGKNARDVRDQVLSMADRAFADRVMSISIFEIIVIILELTQCRTYEVPVRTTPRKNRAEVSRSSASPGTKFQGYATGRKCTRLRW